MFPVFHLAWSTWPGTKTFAAGWRKLLRKVEPGSTLSNKFWLCCSFFIKLKTCRATNLLVPWQINQSARRISSTRNKCFCCESSWSHKVKNGKHRRKLATIQCCATSRGFLYLLFRRRKIILMLLVGLYGRILTSVVCTDLTAFDLYLRPRSRFSHTDLLLG